MFRAHLLATTTLAMSVLIGVAYAQTSSSTTAPTATTPTATTPAGTAPAQAAGDAITLSPVTATGSAAGAAIGTSGLQPSNVSVSPNVERYSLPQTRESIGAQQIEDTTNAIDTEDAVKYLPSIFVRKRNFGDNQPTLETRDWGVNSSARSLVYVDDIPISALIGNNNTNGAPRWGMANLGSITGIDMLYGPFAAEYPGNSMGGVMLITTDMPDHPVATFKQDFALQDFNVYKTNEAFSTSQTSASIGTKYGKVSVFLGASVQDSFSQPLFFVTNGSAPAGTSGTISALNKTGAVADVVGAGGLLHTIQSNFLGKVAVDVTDWLRATYSVGYWSNNQQSKVQTYLTNASGNPTFGGVSGFANDTSTWNEQHLMNAISLKTDTHGDWDWEVVATRYDFLQDIMETPTGVTSTGTSFKNSGYVARLDGTGWSTQDAKGIWRPEGPDGAHEISFGFHRDEYVLENPTYNSNTWYETPATGNGTVYTAGSGKTETFAGWAQEAWKIFPSLKLTVGGRIEGWSAFDGYNLAGTTAANQPREGEANVSPKAQISWQPVPNLTSALSFGQAYRYPTVSELYQIVSTGPVYSIPNANLRPEKDIQFEWATEYKAGDNRVRLSLWQEDDTDAIVQQTNLLNGYSVPVSTWQNVSAIRLRGGELVAEKKNVIFPGIDLSNSVTYVDSDILSDPQFKSTTGTTATGKRVPYVPDWRDTAQAVYRATDELSFSLAARFSGKMYTTLDNTDTVRHVMGAFDRFFVVDTHVHYRVASYLVADVGVDNLFDDKYFEYHPFPGRTYIASAKLTF
jgi:iron complex outermembrane receptor protein